MSIAEKIYEQIVEMPVKEREKLFAAIARRGFAKETYSHEEVFGELRQTPFVISEAAEYLGASVITLRRWVLTTALRTGAAQSHRQHPDPLKYTISRHPQAS